jgi:uncharacterized membrane protein YukC
MMAEHHFWETDGTAQKVLKERASLLDAISPWKQEKKELEEMENKLKDAQKNLEKVAASTEDSRLLDAALLNNKAVMEGKKAEMKEKEEAEMEKDNQIG